MNPKIIKPPEVVPHPFLRWAGGKSWFLKHVHRFLPKEGFNKYVEPFLGGGSMYFHLGSRDAIISDLNEELINAYNVVKGDCESLISEMTRYENSEDFYYAIRSKSFTNDIAAAARFIYLNQTSFNGIYRVNLKGEYNVPYGYRNKEYLDIDTLRCASKALQNADIRSYDFWQTIDDISERDLVFIDPPYTVTHNNNGFIKYNAKLFDIDQQLKLSEYIDHIREKNAFYILTNAAHEEIARIFTRDGERIERISRASLVGGLNAKRGSYEEFIFTNIEANE